MEALIRDTGIKVFAGDISRQETEAIVNPTAAALVSDDPVDMAIRKAGGLGFLKECRHYTARHGEVPAGEAVLTGGGRLAARYVIHAVAPPWSGGLRGEEKLLRRVYRNILRRAAEAGVSSVAIPAVGAGLQGTPVSVTARAALAAVSDYLRKERGPGEIRFVLLSRYDVEVYAQIWEAVGCDVGRPASGQFA